MLHRSTLRCFEKIDQGNGVHDGDSYMIVTIVTIYKQKRIMQTYLRGKIDVKISFR